MVSIPCETVAGEIFYDIGRDGCEDGMDSLVTQPVTVSLYSCGDTPGTDTPLASTTVTDGTYEFGPEATADVNICLTAQDSVFVVFNLGGTLSADGYSFTMGAASGCCLLYTSPSPRDATLSRMPSSA